MRFLSSRGVCRAAGLSLLTLLAASAAQAQSLVLNSGDIMTVSSIGTFGVIGGSPFSSSTSSYYAPGPGPGSNNTAVLVGGTAAFNLTGGSLYGITEQGTSLAAMGSGPVTISSGTVAGGHGIGVNATGRGLVTISGGNFTADPRDGTNLVAGNGASVEVTGGAFDAAPIGASAGGSLYLFSFNDTPFLINGVAMNNMSLMNLSSPFSNTISGTLADGEKLSTNFFDTGTINLNVPFPAAVPEASTTISFGLLLMLGLGGIIMAKRRGTAAASQPSAA